MPQGKKIGEFRTRRYRVTGTRLTHLTETFEVLADRDVSSTEIVRFMRGEIDMPADVVCHRVRVHDPHDDGTTVQEIRRLDDLPECPHGCPGGIAMCGLCEDEGLYVSPEEGGDTPP